MLLLTRNFSKAKAAGYTPLVMIGRADDVDTSVRADPLLRDSSSESERAREALRVKMQALASRLGVPEGTVYYSVPYTEETARRYEIDALTRWNMDAALFAAKEYLKSVHAGNGNGNGSGEGGS